MDNKIMAKKLIALRGDRTLKEVADAVNISERALISYEYGERIPRDEIKIRLASYFGTTVQDIFFSNE